MSDPTLKRSSVTISYAASDGYKMEVNYSTRGRMGLFPPPELPLMEAIEELGRLAELFGFGDGAAERFNDARQRVRQWRAGTPAAQAEKGGDHE